MAKTDISALTGLAPPLTSAEARDQLAEVINRVAFGKERVPLTRRGKPLAAVVPIEDVALLEALEDQRDSAEIHALLAEWRAEGEPTVSFAEVKRGLAARKRRR